jgi:hypothetical protein
MGADVVHRTLMPWIDDGVQTADLLLTKSLADAYERRPTQERTTMSSRPIF